MKISIQIVILILILHNSDGKYKEKTTIGTSSSLKSSTNYQNSKDSENKINLIFKYFEPRNECNFEKDSNNISRYCPSTSDYLFCFPSTPPNLTIFFICPFKKIPINREIKANRYCQLNGTWASTDFTPCLEYLIYNIDSGVCKIKKIYNPKTSEIIEEFVCDTNVDIDAKIFKLMTILNFIGFLITILFVSFAILIFLSIR